MISEYTKKIRMGWKRVQILSQRGKRKIGKELDILKYILSMELNCRQKQGNSYGTWLINKKPGSIK